MTPDFSANSFYSRAYWYRRRESAASIADRFARYLTSLEAVDPLLSGMYVRVRTKGTPFSTALPDLETLVRKSAERDENGKIDPADGFTIGALTRRKHTNFFVRGFVGRDYLSPDMNDVMLTTGAFHPDLPSMTYALFRGATLAMIKCWEPLLCCARPSYLLPYIAPGSWYRESWMTYVHPSLVDRVSPPEIPVVEPTPDGGLLLAATTDTFDIDKPDHLEAPGAFARRPDTSMM